MPTKRCPSCGDEFIATVDRCPDCGVPLVAVDAADAADAGEPPPQRGEGEGADDGELAYDLADWSDEQRRHLDQLLVDVPHVWQGTDLVVPASAQEVVDPLVDDLDLAAELALDPQADRIAYEVGDFDDEQLQDLIDSLVAEAIPHEFLPDSGELLVHEADEERVEVVIDRFDFPDALPVDDEDDAAADGLEVQEVLGDLFVAADRLKGDGGDPAGLLDFFGAAQRLDDLDVPYGFDAEEWERLTGEITQLRLLIEGDDGADDDIAVAAGAVRDLLRRYV